MHKHLLSLTLSGPVYDTFVLSICVTLHHHNSPAN